MRKSMKKIWAAFSAAIMAGSALAVAACGTPLQTVDGYPEGDAISNGGFVVEVDNYYYFINGVASYTDDNTYGTPVKGALMRAVKNSDGTWGESETVIPSLMVAGDYTAGLFIYGDRVYYASPTNVKDTEGVVANTRLDFLSAKLDGSDIREYVRVSSNSATYRFVEVNETVYLLYVTGTSAPYELHSFNTATETDTVLADSATEYAFDVNDKESPVVYYTMNVTEDLDSDEPDDPYSYNQIYRVSAEATAENNGYDYSWDPEWLKDHDEPYINLGDLVLDGRGANDAKTKFNQSDEANTPPYGYSYSLRRNNSNLNGGLYFTRAENVASETVGADGALYYLDGSLLNDANWAKDSSVTANKDKLDVVAKAGDVEEASETALFYTEGTGEARTHHYVYVSDGSIWNVDLDAAGTPEKTEVAHSVGAATLLNFDFTSSNAYKYVYFSRTNSGSLSIERAVINGDEKNYKDLVYSDEEGNKEDNTAWHSVAILDLKHNSSWYSFEIIGTDLFFADAETAFGGTAYNYVSVVDLKNAEGKLMDNAEIAAFNEKLEEITGDKGVLSVVTDKVNQKLSDAIKYFFYTGERKQLDENIAEAAELDPEADALYNDDELATFAAFVKNDKSEVKYKDVTLVKADALADEDGVSYRTYSYFVTKLGKMNDADAEAYSAYWKTAIEHVTVEEETSEGLAGWKIALIVIACVLVVGAAVAVPLVYKFVIKKRKKEAPKPRRMYVDTTDDKDIDVYDDGSGSSDGAEGEEDDTPTEE